MCKRKSYLNLKTFSEFNFFGSSHFKIKHTQFKITVFGIYLLNGYFRTYTNNYLKIEVTCLMICWDVLNCLSSFLFDGILEQWITKILVTARKRSLGQGNIFTSVFSLSRILFTGGVCLSACWDTTAPLLGADTPREQTPTPSGAGTPPLAQCMLVGDTVHKRAVCILLECNLVVDDSSPWLKFKREIAGMLLPFWNSNCCAQ